MNSEQFRIYGKQMVDYIADYLDNISQRRVTPDVEPGYLKDMLPNEAPMTGESWDSILLDVENKIMPGITHWQHPHFHAYFPAGNSYPSLLGEMLSSGLGIVGFSWAASPACTELETIVLNWLGKMLGLPKELLPFGDDTKIPSTNNSASNSNGSGENTEEQNAYCDDDEVLLPTHTGGAVILSTASECVLVSMLSARSEMLHRLKAKHPFVEDGVLLSKLVAYTSKLGHSCVEKAAMIAMIKIRLLDTDHNYSLRGSTLETAMADDRSNGLIPFFVSCTLGTTSCCTYDNVVEIGAICKRDDVRLHVDAAYAGCALICEEFRPLMKGLELVDSFNICANKWLMINFDCSCLWVRDKYNLTKALSVDPIYLRYKDMDKAIDYRHFGIALSRRFRALKMWFTIRTYGIEGIQKYIRLHQRLAKVFEGYVRSDSRFEIMTEVTLGLVCFRLKGPNALSQNLLFTLNDCGKIHMVPAMLDDKYTIRFCVNAPEANEDDMKYAWEIIRTTAEDTLKKYETERIVKNDLLLPRVTSEIRRLRFGVSRVVSDPRNYRQKKYKRTQTTTRFTSDSGKYLARKCSIVEDDEDL